MVRCVPHYHAEGGDEVIWGCRSRSKNERAETGAAIQLMGDAEQTCLRNACDALHEVEIMDVGGSKE